MGLLLALACDLTNEWPGDAWNRDMIEIELAAYLQARIYEEQYSE